MTQDKTPRPDFSRLQEPDARPEHVLRYSVAVEEPGDQRVVVFVDNATGQRHAALVTRDEAAAARYRLLCEAFVRFLNTGGSAQHARLTAGLVEACLDDPGVPPGLTYTGTDATGTFDHLFAVEGVDPPAFVRVVEGAEGFAEYLAGVDLERHAMQSLPASPHAGEDD